MFGLADDWDGAAIIPLTDNQEQKDRGKPESETNRQSAIHEIVPEFLRRFRVAGRESGRCELVLDDIGFFEEFLPIEFWVGLKSKAIVKGVAAFGRAVPVMKAVEAWIAVGSVRGGLP